MRWSTSRLRPAEDGIDEGLIARVWNLSPSPASFSATFTPGPVAQAWHTSHIETPVEEMTVTGGVLADTLAAQQLKTYSVQLSISTLDERAYLPLVLTQPHSQTQSSTRCPTRDRDNRPRATKPGILRRLGFTRCSAGE